MAHFQWNTSEFGLDRPDKPCLTLRPVLFHLHSKVTPHILHHIEVGALRGPNSLSQRCTNFRAALDPSNRPSGCMQGCSILHEDVLISCSFRTKSHKLGTLEMYTSAVTVISRFFKVMGAERPFEHTSIDI
jgi:hypothetical protein